MELEPPAGPLPGERGSAPLDEGDAGGLRPLQPSDNETSQLQGEGRPADHCSAAADAGMPGFKRLRREPLERGPVLLPSRPVPLERVLEAASAPALQRPDDGELGHKSGLIAHPPPDHPGGFPGGAREKGVNLEGTARKSVDESTGRGGGTERVIGIQKPGRRAATGSEGLRSEQPGEAASDDPDL